MGYCYNTIITAKEEAEKNFTELFDVEVKKHVGFINYVVDNPIVDDRIIMNGNRLFFLEQWIVIVQTYIEWIKMCWDYIFQGQDQEKRYQDILNRHRTLYCGTISSDQV